MRWPCVMDTCFVIQMGTETGEGLQFLELRVGQLEVAGQARKAASCALPPTRGTDRPRSTAGSTPT